MYSDITFIGSLIHYGTIACAVCINALSAGIGGGLTSSSALDASNRQPHAHALITRASILGMALIETTAIMGIFIAILLLKTERSAAISLYADISIIGIGLAICISGLVLGLVCAKPAQAACYSIARQPENGQQIIGFMIMMQALVQTPLISSLIIALFIHNQAPFVTNLGDSLRLIASGLCIGLGSVGPAIGLATFAQAACLGIGYGKAMYSRLISFALISEAIIETPVIFAMTVAITLLYQTAPTTLDGITFFAAGLCAGLGTLGSGIASGKTAAAACTQIVQHPDEQASIARTSLFGQGMIDTCAIYAILVAYMLILFTR